MFGRLCFLLSGRLGCCCLVGQVVVKLLLSVRLG
jgi:hypothetical protein